MSRCSTSRCSFSVRPYVLETAFAWRVQCAGRGVVRLGVAGSDFSTSPSSRSRIGDGLSCFLGGSGGRSSIATCVRCTRSSHAIVLTVLGLRALSSCLALTFASSSPLLSFASTWFGAVLSRFSAYHWLMISFFFLMELLLLLLRLGLPLPPLLVEVLLRFLLLHLTLDVDVQLLLQLLLPRLPPLLAPVALRLARQLDLPYLL
mmetsp:Transcript_16876/g.48010  ORF Transcript_16876/g.48010 Transcript_16876/m.48010 type:complete len:204 (-) Transcript_16876:312-923(-)